MGEAFKLGKSLYGVVGSVSRSAELKNTQNGKTFAKFSVKAGKRDDDSWVYVDCKAWGPLAGYCADLQKGDPFIGIGRIESREYNDKTYTDLILDWCNSPMLATAAEAPPLPSPAPAAASEDAGPRFSEVEGDDDSEDGLPF